MFAWNKKPCRSSDCRVIIFNLVAHWRFELQTPWLKVKCSTGWASEPYGWGGRIWTYECGSQRPVPYPLATPQCFEAKSWGGIWDSNPWYLVPQTSALTNWTNPTISANCLEIIKKRSFQVKRYLQQSALLHVYALLYYNSTVIYI